MASNPLFYQLLLVALVLICLLLHVGLTDNPPRVSHAPLEPNPRRRRRTKEPKPFIGLIHKPLCEACELEADRRPKAPESPPPMITFTRGRRRRIDTHAHFCPAPDCAYRGWLGRGNIRANGHPGRQAWRQLQCVSCHGSFSETHGCEVKIFMRLCGDSTSGALRAALGIRLGRQPHLLHEAPGMG
jgi:hypothetical protein